MSRRSVNVGFGELTGPADDREQFIRDNAVSLVEQRDAKIRRQAEVLRKLNRTMAGLRIENTRLRRALRALRAVKREGEQGCG